jgi:4a-hydroxytetrahydrobiopterin dehydratase
MDEAITGECLRDRKCVPCEGGVPKLNREAAVRLLAGIPDWTLDDEATRIERRWVVKDFDEAIAFFQRIAAVADDEDHHPDLHLESFRNVRVELWTHAIGGLSENDFIVAAKIDSLPVELRKKPA